MFILCELMEVSVKLPIWQCVFVSMCKVECVYVYVFTCVVWYVFACASSYAGADPGFQKRGVVK